MGDFELGELAVVGDRFAADCTSEGDFGPVGVLDAVGDFVFGGDFVPAGDFTPPCLSMITSGL